MSAWSKSRINSETYVKNRKWETSDDEEDYWDVVEAMKEINIGLETGPVKWFDEYFEMFYTPLCMLKQKIALSESVLAAKSFLNWYVSGVTPKEPSDVVLALLYGMTTDGQEDMLFDPDLWGYDKCVQTLSSFGTVEKLTTIQYTSSAQGAIRQAGTSSGTHTTTGSTLSAVTNETITDWYNALWSSLSSQNGGTKKQLLNLKMTLNYIGFLAMTMLSLTNKDTKMVSMHIFTQTLGKFNKLWNFKASVKATYPPHGAMMVRFALHFKRFTTSARRCLAAIVYTYGHVEISREKSVRGILRAGCLLSLENTGLGCYHWTQSAAEVLGIDVHKLMGYMAIPMHLDTNAEITKILELNAAKQYSWPWARMFVDKAFPNLSIKENPLYAAVMVGVVTGSQGNHELWRIPSIRSHIHDWLKDQGLHYAERLKTLVKQARTDTPSNISEVCIPLADHCSEGQ